MNRNEVLAVIKESLEKVLDQEISITEESHLMEEGILDSLDSAVFIFEIESATQKKLPGGDISEQDLYRVSKLIDYLTGK